MLKKKVKGSAIQYALMFSVLVALILGGFMLFISANKQMITKLNIQEELLSNAISGIEYGKAEIKNLNYDELKIISLFNGRFGTVELKKKRWGSFDVLHSEAIHFDKKRKKIALLGSTLNNVPNLYLSDLGSPINVCGRTVLKGVLEVPSRGLKRGYIAGQNFEGQNLYEGKIKNSNNELPSYNFNSVFEMFSSFSIVKESWINTSVDQKISFDTVVKYYYSDKPISISNCNLEGQIIIESSDSIFVSKSSNLNYVILKSPKVFFEKGFIGNVQVFSSERIVLEEEVNLIYPSVLAVKSEVSNINTSITIGKNSKVLGSVFLLHNLNQRIALFFKLGINAELHGICYCSGMAEIKGVVNGHLITNKFFLKTASSYYENYLLNAKIIDDLPKEFSIPALFENNKIIRITWLN